MAKRPARKVWADQAESILKLLGDLASSPTVHGLKWKQGMLKHYGKQLDDHLKNPPRGCRPEALLYRARAKEIADKVNKP